jgi:MFS family permease
MWCLAGGVGPVIGGAFTQYASWRWCFWINIPVSGTTFILLVLFLDVHNPKTEILDGIKAIDWWGSFSILGLTLMLLLGLDFGGVIFPWNSPKVICLIVFGCLMSILFIFSEKRLARYPLMPLSLFRNPSNVASLVLCFVHGFVSRPRQYFVEIIQTDRFWCRSS